MGRDLRTCPRSFRTEGTDYQMRNLLFIVSNSLGIHSWSSAEVAGVMTNALTCTGAWSGPFIWLGLGGYGIFMNTGSSWEAEAGPV